MHLAPVFSDHAVLQRNQPIPVWGTAGADQEVHVSLAGNEATVIAAADGSWTLRLPPLPAGGPYELVAKSASGEARVRDRFLDVVARNDEGLRTVREHGRPTRVGAQMLDEMEALHVRHLALAGPLTSGVEWEA